MMWTCTKCSFAYNKVEASKCEVCNVQRALQKDLVQEKLSGSPEEQPPQPLPSPRLNSKPEAAEESNGETPIVNSEIIQVSFLFGYAVLNMPCKYVGIKDF